MSFKLLKTGLLCAALGLASCGGGGSGTTAPTANNTGDTTNPANVVVVANSGTVTVTTVPNNVVSIGASGTNARIADATGKAVFAGLPAGAVDVHVFSADGYSATSYMGINSASITDATGTSTGSVVDVYVQLINADVYGQNVYLQTTNNTYQGWVNSTTGNASINVWDQPAGTAITGSVYVVQGLATSSAGNTVFGGGAEMLNLGSLGFTTTATTGTAQANLMANFAAVTPTPPLLATILSVTPPTGMVVSIVFFGEVNIWNGGGSTGLVFPDTIHSAMIGNNFNVFAEDTANNTGWSYSGATFAAGDTLSATATATLSLPSMAANQTGNTLSWTNNSTTQSLNVVDIYDGSFTYDWLVFAASQVSSVSLPTVPVGVAAPLVVGRIYSVDIISVKEASGASYEQTITSANSGGQFKGESIGRIAVAYTR